MTTVVAKLDRNFQQVYRYTFAQPNASFPAAIVVDRQGSAFVAGSTGAQSARGFISKLDASGSMLLFSTYLGTSVNALAVDTAGNLYATGYGRPNEIVVTSGAYRGPTPAASGEMALFVAKLTGDRLIYTAMLGPAIPRGIATSPDGTVIVVGRTSDASYPTTPDAFQGICHCGVDIETATGIVSRLSVDGSSLVWSTFLGSDGKPDELQFVAVAPDGGAIVAGTATSADFPTTEGAFQTGHGLGDRDFVVAKLDPSGSSLIYSSRFGSSQDDQLTGFQVDAQGRAWIAGSTSRSDFPVLADSPAVGNSVVAALDADGSKLVRTQLLPDGVATVLLVNAAGEEILFGVAGSFLRLGSEGLAGAGILGVGNAVPQEAAGYTISGAVAPGEIVSLYGVALGPSTGAGAQLDSTGKVSTVLAGTQVLFDGAPAPLLYVDANQINAVVPFAVGDRAGTTVEVRTLAGRSSGAMLRVVAADPALPSVMKPGSGYISLVLNQDGSVNSLANRAASGEVIAFWVNGAGRFQQNLEDGAIVGSERAAPMLPVSVRISPPSLPAEVLYAGTAPGMVAGMMQVNIRIPPNTGMWSYGSIELRLGDFVAYGSVATK